MSPNVGLRAGMLAAVLSWGIPVSAHEPDETAETQPTTPDVRAPALLERVEPVYPEAARRDGIGGVVGLELEVLADGTVGNVKVVRPAGFGFDEAAVTAARQF